MAANWRFEHVCPFVAGKGCRLFGCVRKSRIFLGVGQLGQTRAELETSANW